MLRAGVPRRRRPAGAGTGRSGGHDERSRSIGVATREADGTIVLKLRTRGGNDAVAENVFRYPPGDKDCPMVARHVGPIPTGGSVPVRPFPVR